MECDVILAFLRPKPLPVSSYFSYSYAWPYSSLSNGCCKHATIRCVDVSDSHHSPLANSPAPLPDLEPSAGAKNFRPVLALLEAFLESSGGAHNLEVL